MRDVSRHNKAPAVVYNLHKTHSKYRLDTVDILIRHCMSMSCREGAKAMARAQGVTRWPTSLLNNIMCPMQQLINTPRLS